MNDDRTIIIYSIIAVVIVIVIVLIIILYKYLYPSSITINVPSKTNPNITSSLTLQNGDLIECTDTGNIYQIMYGTKQLYSSAAYQRNNYPAITQYILCSTLSTIPNGTTIN